MVYIQWTHQTIFNSEFEAEDKTSIRLNYDHSYSFDEIKEEFTKAFAKSDKGKFYFENAVIKQIGVGKEDVDVITKFVNSNGKIIPFWDFAKIVRGGGNKLNFLILTTLCDSTKPNQMILIRGADLMTVILQILLNQKMLR